MPTGYNVAGDIITRLKDGTDVNTIWADLQEVIAEINAKRGTLTSLLSFKTTNASDPVLQAFTGGDFEPASEYGEPLGLRPGTEAIGMGYTFGWYDLAARFTWQYLADATSAQVDAVANAAAEADSRLLFNHVMTALFNNAQRMNKEGINVYPLWNGDGMVPPEHNGETFDGTHNHFVTTGTDTLDQVDVDDLMELVREHGYGEDGTRGQLLLIAHREQADVIRGFRTTATGGAGKYDFIPGESAPPRLTSEVVVGDTPPARYGSVPLIGAYGPAWVAENSLIPKGYVLCAVSDGPNSPYNVLGYRQHPTTNLQGLRLVKGRTPDYPLIDSFWVHGLGTGVRHRGAAAVLQVSANSTYSAPSQFGGAR